MRVDGVFMSTFMDYITKFLELCDKNRGIVQMNKETFAFSRQNMDYRMFYVIFNIASFNFEPPMELSRHHL